MHRISSQIRSSLLVAVATIGLGSAGGCTSIIGSAYLREAWLDAVEQAAERRSGVDDADRNRGGLNAESMPGTDGRLVNDEAAPAPEIELTETAVWSPATLDEAVAEADLRMAAVGGLGEPARAALVATLEATPRRDWAVVVEEFTATLARSQAAAPPAIGGVPPRPAVSAAATPVAAPVAAADEPVAPMPPHDTAANAAVAPPPRAADAPQPPEFAVRNACFASRVRAWGVVDRFETAEFAPRQELIVYFELDGLASRPSPEGHVTRIDTRLRLVADDGTTLHDWAFEPLEESCQNQRRDYFARYLVAIPEALPGGPCRLEIAVTDAVGGRSARASLPLAVVR